MDNSSFNSSIKKLRENFSKQIRKSQIQKIQKQKRQRYMKTFNPIFYLEKLKIDLMNEQLQIQRIKEGINFISQNIKNQQFAHIVEKQQLIEVIILKTIQLIQPWIQSDSSKLNKQSSKYCLFPGRCQCLDCSQNSTSISENCQGQFLNEVIEIDQVSSLIKNPHEKQYLLLSDLLDLLSVTFQIASIQIKNQNSQQFTYLKSSQDQTLLLKPFPFKDLFMQTPQILQGFMLDLINYQKCIFFKQNNHKQVQNIESNYPLIFKIVTLLSKYVQISCFDEDQWNVILQNYVIYSMKISTQVKNQCQNIIQIKEILILLSKSYLSKDILSNTKFINQINKLIFPWLRYFNQTFTDQNNKRNDSKIKFSQQFIEEFQYALKILEDLKFLDKNVNEEIKLILGQILNISTSLERDGNTSLVNCFHISPKIYQKQDFDIQRKFRLYAEKLIQILYLQMELTDDDLNMITQLKPSMKAKIQKIIDADCY